MNHKPIRGFLDMLVVTMIILPFVVTDFVEAKKDNLDYDKTSLKIDQEIKEFVRDSDKFSTEPEKLAKLNEAFKDKKEHLIYKYQEKIDDDLGKLLNQKYLNMTSEERSNMIYYIISEKFKSPLQEKFVSDMLANEEGINIMGFEIIPSVYATCNRQPNVTIFKQLDLDITGQIGFEGNNDLETVQRNDLSSCLREYTLTFSDEDHPVPHIDANYDLLRLYEYGRIQDVEKFYVSNGNIWFLDTASKSQSFWTLLPIHYQETTSFTNTVYVSNTWNHLMETSNTNLNQPMRTWYK